MPQKPSNAAQATSGLGNFGHHVHFNECPFESGKA